MTDTRQTATAAGARAQHSTSASGERRADYRQNPYTLVYDGAITKNEPGKVNSHPVTYTLNGPIISANVYAPANDDPAKKTPTVAVARPNGGVKEQAAGLYTASVWPSRAASRWQRMPHARARVAVSLDRADEQSAGWQFDLYREGYHHYWRTHAHPRSTFRYTTGSLLDVMRFDATDQSAPVTQPLLMMAGTRADGLYMTEEAFPKATGTTDRRFFPGEGATHIQTYGEDVGGDARRT